MKAIKYLFALILTAAVVIGSALLCACNGESKGEEYYLNHSKAYSLEEAYDGGLINQNDLMHIAYYESGAVYKVKEGGVDKWEKLDFTPEKERPVLNKETEDKIKSSYYYHYPKPFKDSDGKFKYGKDIIKVYYLGCYNGCYVAVIDSDLWSYPAVIDSVCIGGIGWTQPYPYSIHAFVFED